MVRRVEGSLLEIKLGGNQKAYARVLPDTLFAFYLVDEDRPIEPSHFATARPVFTLPAMKYAVTSGRWPVVAKWPLEEELTTPIPFFMQDRLNGELSLYIGGVVRPADITECLGLECAAVWDPEHVEDRLRDQLAGVPNKWVESLKLNAQRVPKESRS
ncbi:Imm26 family immunity protein [Rhizobium sp. RCC_161_2]|uniref:Imm26 family immunity protein n=1 Tax=Rhizobium sp. RCC_161_2 TaxID=3239219 RepID=UPI003525AAFF